MRGRQPEEQLPRASLAASVGAINLRIPKLRAAIAAVPGILKAVFAERDPELVREPYQLATERIEGFCPKAAEVLEEAEAGAPAYLDFPYGHRVRLRADNVQGRTVRELRRRGRVVQVFPSRKSPIRMMGAVFAEMDEDWAGRRRLDDDSIGRAVEGAEVNAPAPAYGGHRRGARCRDHRARRGRQPRSRREGGLT